MQFCDSSASGAAFPFPKEGLTIQAIADFIKANGGKENFKGLTTNDVCTKFLKPATKKGNKSYCEAFKKKLGVGGKATVFICHAWALEFIETVNSLENYFKDTPDVFIWIDLFSNNQHKPDMPFEWFATTLKSAIQEIGRTVLILSPWRINHYAFFRSWCLFEIYCTIVTKSKFEVAMTMEDMREFAWNPSDEGQRFYYMVGEINLEKLSNTGKTSIKRIYVK